MDRVFAKLLGAAVIVGVFVLGLYLDHVGFRVVSIAAVSLVLIAIIYVPAQFSLHLIITFIWFQGFFKIVSNYHPLVHVGADLVVMVLLLKLLFISPNTYKKSPPLVGLFLLHFAWVVVTCFNPYSLGLVANVAGAKVYVSMFLLYFFGYYLVNNLSDVKRLFVLFIILAFVQTVFTIYQGMKGPTSVVSLHPGYQIQLNRFVGYAFRPFGLTNVPGGPSVYIYLTLPFVVYSIYSARSALFQLFQIATLPLFGLALVMCQVRSAIGKGVLAVVLFIVAMVTSGLPISAAKRAYSVLGAGFAAVVVVFALTYLMDASVTMYGDNEMAMERSASTFDIQAMAQARRGALERFMVYAQQIPFGAGFSRSGAAAGAFGDANKSDTYFKPGYFFADNLFVHLLIEMGIPGVIIVGLLVGCILFIGFQIWRHEKRVHLIGPQLAIWSSLVAITVGSYGGEGIVYNPESCFFWLFAGVMMSLRDPLFESIKIKSDDSH